MTTPNEELITIATRHQVHLERLKASEVKKLQVVVNKAATAVVSAIREVDVTYISDMTVRNLRSLLIDIKGIQSVYLKQAIESHVASYEDLTAYEQVFEIKSLDKVLKAGTALTVPDAKKALAKALRKPLSATGTLLEPFLKNWGVKEIAAVQNTIRKGYADGWTVTQLTESIRGTRQLNYRDGLVATSNRNASAVARTAIQHIASSAREVVWAENANVITGYRWVSTLDSNTTPQCQGLDGQVFKLGRGPMPPIHIGCRSTTVAEIAKEFQLPVGDSKRSSSTGLVPAEQTYYGWLKNQPAAFQNSAIGTTRGKLLRNGGLDSERFAKLNLNRNFKPMTLDEMRILEPVAFEKAGL